METSYEGHMAAEVGGGALCKNKDACIIDAAYGPNLEGISCSDCIAKVRKIFGDANLTGTDGMFFWEGDVPHTLKDGVLTPFKA